MEGGKEGYSKNDCCRGSSLLPVEMGGDGDDERESKKTIPRISKFKGVRLINSAKKREEGRDHSQGS